MKTFSQLSETEQAAAVEHFTVALATECVEGLRFNDEANGDNLQKKIDKAIGKAERMQTPWFAVSYVLDAVRGQLEGMARCNAEDTLYLENHENTLHIGQLKQYTKE